MEQERRLAEQERAIGSSHRPEAGQDRQVATERRREDPVRLPPELTRGEARAGGPGVADLNGALHDEGRLTPPHYSNDGGEQAGEAAYRREQAGEVAYPREQAGEAAYPREQAGEVAYPREQAGEVTYRREQAGGPDRAPLAGNRLNVRPKDEDGDTAAEERQSSGGSLAEETLGRGEMGPATRRQWRAGMERAKTSPDDPGDGWHRPSHRNGGGSRVYGEYLELLRETEQLIPVEDNDNGARPLDVNLLSGLTRWASVAQSRVGEKGLKEVLDLYARSGHLSEGLRSVLLQVSGMVGGVPPEAGHNAQEYVDLICQLHGILTGSLHISQAPPARPLE